MGDLKEYSFVRVRQLLRAPDHYNGWNVNKRPPQVGDEGTIVDVLQAPGLPDSYVVESSGKDGVTIWLGNFTAEELSLREPSPNKPTQPTPR